MAEPRPEVLLSLLAVRLLGPEGLPATAPVLNAMKGEVAEALELGLLREETIRPLTKSGKPGRKTIQQVRLSEAGEQAIMASARPEAIAARTFYDLAAFRQQLDADRDALHQAFAALTWRLDSALQRHPAITTPPAPTARAVPVLPAWSLAWACPGSITLLSWPPCDSLTGCCTA